MGYGGLSCELSPVKTNAVGCPAAAGLFFVESIGCASMLEDKAVGQQLISVSARDSLRRPAL